MEFASHPQANELRASFYRIYSLHAELILKEGPLDQKILTAPQRALASIVRSTRSNIQPLLSSLGRTTLLHPALSHPAEEDLIQHSLDLSFQQTIAVSRLDRQIIDNLSRNGYSHFQLS